jgi:hypothetical protein
MKNPAMLTPVPVVEEDILRDYAYHRYLHEGCVPGRELAVWREALACLKGHVSAEQSEGFFPDESDVQLAS